jgi:hypothetical protein
MYDKYISTNISYQDRIYSIGKKLKEAISYDDIINIYDDIYKGYRSDPIYGLIDWSPSITTVIVKEKDDCDGMAVTWSYLANKFFSIKDIKIKSIKTYCFVNFGWIWDISQSHVMCVVDTDDGLYLFDYKTIRKFDSFDQIRLYFKNYYASNSKIENIIIREIPIPISPKEDLLNKI